MDRSRVTRHVVAPRGASEPHFYEVFALQVVELKIEGMTCGGCVHAVRNVLGRVPNAESVDVSVGRAVLRFGSAWDGDTNATLAAIERAGFSATIESSPPS
jgi:copper chaperone CopZ